MSDDNKLGLLGLDEGGDVVQTVLYQEGLGSLGLRAGLSSSLGRCNQTLLLLTSSFGAILVQKLEKIHGSIFVESLRELVDGRGDLDTHTKNLALLLETNVARPFYKAGKITLGLNVVADAVVLDTLLEQRVLSLRLLGLVGEGSGSDFLFSFEGCLDFSFKRCGFLTIVNAEKLL